MFLHVCFLLKDVVDSLCFARPNTTGPCCIVTGLVLELGRANQFLDSIFFVRSALFLLVSMSVWSFVFVMVFCVCPLVTSFSTFPRGIAKHLGSVY